MRDVTAHIQIFYMFHSFLLTRPMRDVTDMNVTDDQLLLISTHTSHAGRDPRHMRAVSLRRHFYSHVPCGT